MHEENTCIHGQTINQLVVVDVLCMLNIREFRVHQALGIYPTDAGEEDVGDDSGKHLFIPLALLVLCSSDPFTAKRVKGQQLSAYRRSTGQVTTFSLCVSGQ